MLNKKRYQINIGGLVQGVGFRPYVVMCANQYGLSGWVKNTNMGVLLELEGPENALHQMLNSLSSAPTPIRVESLNHKSIPLTNESEFVIQPSDSAQSLATTIPPDIAICRQCLDELKDPNNRRFFYPFISCAQCGPRYSILKKMPFDRQHTAFHEYTMCTDCKSEHEDPKNRRYHAQTISCPSCGPRYQLRDHKHRVIAIGSPAILQACQLLNQSKIVAVRGISGFHLYASAQDKSSIQLLRLRKHRPYKAFALLFASLETTTRHCIVSKAEASLLSSNARPIVLVQKRGSAILPEEIAPENAYHGVMLPHSGLQQIIMSYMNEPIIVTSGNQSGDALCVTNQEASTRLSAIADYYLTHELPLEKGVDDSVMQIVNNLPMTVRVGRGLAPLHLNVCKDRQPILALGSYLKNTLAINYPHGLILSQHQGDLNHLSTISARNATLDTFMRYIRETPKIIVDRHPDQGMLPPSLDTSHTTSIQHHFAHAVSGLIDNDIKGPILACVWDGLGLGDDNRLWGGEFLMVTCNHYTRIGHLDPLPLIGGINAIKEPRRVALGLLYRRFGKRLFQRKDLLLLKCFTHSELALFKQMLQSDLHCQETTSIGRLFDGVAAMLGLVEVNAHEGHAACTLQSSALKASACEDVYPMPITGSMSCRTVDWKPLIEHILRDIQMSTQTSLIAMKFHNTLATLVIRFAQDLGEQRVLLSGGCFQNKLLLERCVHISRQHGIKVYRHHRIPPNDGGLAVGQLAAAYSQQSNASLCA